MHPSADIHPKKINRSGSYQTPSLMIKLRPFYARAFALYDVPLGHTPKQQVATLHITLFCLSNITCRSFSDTPHNNILSFKSLLIAVWPRCAQFPSELPLV